MRTSPRMIAVLALNAAALTLQPTAARPGAGSLVAEARPASGVATTNGAATTWRWRRYGPGDSVLPGPSVRYAEFDAKGVLWLRVARPESGPDFVVVAPPETRWQLYDDLQSVVTQHYDTVVSTGSLRDMWAVDRSGRVWIGPEHYDGRQWLVVADDASQGGHIRYDARALVDATDQATVPYVTAVDCPLPGGCTYSGLRGYYGDKLAFDLPLEPAAEADRFGVAVVHLFSSWPGRQFDLAAATAQALRPAYAAARKAVYVLPDTTALAYPLLEAPTDPSGPALRNAGYATAATLRPDGRLQVVTWVEEHAAPPDRRVTWRILVNTLIGRSWEVADITTSPLFGGDPAFERVLAAEYCADGTLWLATHAGALGGRHVDGSWEIATGALPLGNGEHVTDLACGPDGRLWLATDRGLLAGAPVEATLVYLPLAVTR